MTVWIKKILLIVSLLIIKTLLFSQILDTRRFKIEDGQNPIKIFCLFKTHQGYIYTGTSDGVYKFDGLNFIKIPFVQRASKEAITAISEDSKNQLWVGSQSGNIARLVNGKFE